MSAELEVSKNLLTLENAASQLQNKRQQFEESERRREAARKTEQTELRAAEERLQREKSDAVRSASRNLQTLLRIAWSASRLTDLYGRAEAEARLNQRAQLLKLVPSLPIVPLRASEVISRYGGWLKQVDVAVFALHDNMSSSSREIKIGRQVIVDGSQLFYFTLVRGRDDSVTLFLSYSKTRGQLLIGAATPSLALALPLSKQLDILKNIPLNIRQSEAELTLGTAYVLSQELMSSPSAAAINF